MNNSIWSEKKDPPDFIIVDIAEEMQYSLVLAHNNLFCCRYIAKWDEGTVSTININVSSRSSSKNLDIRFVGWGGHIQSMLRTSSTVLLIWTHFAGIYLGR